MKLIEEKLGGYMGDNSVALDTRTGETFSYDSKQNPYSRKPTEIGDMRLRIRFESLARLAYAPERA